MKNLILAVLLLCTVSFAAASVPEYDTGPDQVKELVSIDYGVTLVAIDAVNLQTVQAEYNIKDYGTIAPDLFKSYPAAIIAEQKDAELTKRVEPYTYNKIPIYRAPAKYYNNVSDSVKTKFFPSSGGMPRMY